MFEIKIKEKVYDIPSSWDEVKFTHYCKFVDLQSDDKFKAMIPERQFVKMLSMLNDDSDAFYITLQELSLININAIAEHCSYLSDMDALNELAKRKPGANAKNEVKFGKEVYGIYDDFNNMSIGDKEAFERAKTQLENNFNLNPLMIGLAFLLRKKKEGSLEEFSIDSFMDCLNRVIPQSGWTLKDVMYYVGFFLIGVKKSTNNSKDFSIQIKSLQSTSPKKKSSKQKMSKKSI